ncbi:MAG: hypothetical protein SV966_16205 [Actinomycetota bacterium]|nr:hypothetical protein [Actinomycetota bacterium]
MAYDADLAERGVAEKRMVGGLAFLLDGNMAVAWPAVMAGREVRGWLRVDDDGVRVMRQLRCWMCRGVDHAKALPK